MLQRIQSLYLFIAAVLLAGLLYPLSYVRFITNDAQLYLLGPNGLVRFVDGEVLIRIIPVVILVGLTVVVALVTIFLFKNRTLQMRLSVFNMLMMIGILILLGYYIFYVKKQLDARILFRSPLILPLLAILFTYLAFRNIRKDDILVKSVDRLR